MNECTICFQEYGNGCLPATLPCGHLNCFDCLTLLANENPNAVCPCCRKPYFEGDITKLFLTFPVPAPADPTLLEGAEESYRDSDPAEPPPLTDEQKNEANDLSARMSALGIPTDIEELGRVLSDVKLWATGVGAISDMETQIAMTRLLLNIDILRRKTEGPVLSAAGARQTKAALAASRRAEASLRDKLNRENANTVRLREAGIEQLARRRRLGGIVTASKARIDKLEEDEIEHLAEISSLTKEVKDQALEIASLSKAVGESEKRASELEDKCRSMCTDKKRYDKRVASLEKELDAQEQIIRQLGRDLRDEKECAEEHKENTEAEVARLVKKLRDMDDAKSDCQRELARVNAALDENACQILRLKQDREHWREEYFKLKENGSSPNLAHAVPEIPVYSQDLHAPSAPYTGPNNLIDLSDESNDSLLPPPHTAPVQPQCSARSLSVVSIPRPPTRCSKRPRIDTEYNFSFSHRKRRVGADNEGSSDSDELRSMIGQGNDEDASPRRKIRRKIALGFESRRKASSEYRGLTPLHEFLASAEEDDG